MKRKRHDSNGSTGTSTVSNKILCLQNGSHVEVQLDDGKWHSGTIIQCQPRKYLVQVEEQQYWTDVDLIRSTTLVDQKRTVPFEYRPGQFLRNEIKSPTKIVAEEKVSPSIEASVVTRKRVPRTTAEPKKSPFVWKPSTISSIQTRRSSKNGQVELVSNENQCRTRTSSNPSPVLPTPEVLIFRPIIRFVESSSTNVSGDEDPSDSILLCQLNTATDSRSSSRTSTDNPYSLQSLDPLPTANNNNKPEASKGSCFLETPPPSLPDIHLTQDSESPPANLHQQQQFKSKRKQDRPQRKALPKEKSVVVDEEEVLPVRSTTTTDAGYLSDEYSEPIRSDQMDLEQFAQRLTTPTTSTSSFVLTGEKKIFYEEFHSFISKNVEHYQQLEDSRRETYRSSDGNTRLTLISQILKELFSIGYQRDLNDLVEFIPEEIHKHFKVCFNQFRQPKKKLPQRVKRLTGQVRQAKTKKSNDLSIPIEQEQQMLLSPASPVTEELLSPNTTTTIAELTVLPKERDVYEIIHCLCQCEVDNGFMIQCETCLCWSHCECVGVTPTCIPAFFKCSVCTKAEADRPCSSSSYFDDDLVSHFSLSSGSAEEMSLILTYSRRLWNLREQMIELQLRSTPQLRTLEHALRSDDLLVLSPYTDLTSEQLFGKISERQAKRTDLQSIVQTLDSLVDDVSASMNTSRCPSIDLSSNGSSTEIRRDRSLTDLLISHLCDDEQIRQIRSAIRQRYEQTFDDVQRQIQNILLEHQTIEREMQMELSSLQSCGETSLDYEKHQSALRTAIERLKT